MNSQIYNRTKELCSKNKVKLSELARAINISETSFRKWKESSPSIETAKKIADYFSVSVDYLIGASEIKETADRIAGDECVIAIKKALSNMSEADKELMMQLLKRAFKDSFDL